MELMNVVAAAIEERGRLDAAEGMPDRSREQWLSQMQAALGKAAQAHNKGCSNDEFAMAAIRVAAVALGLARDYADRADEDA